MLRLSPKNKAERIEQAIEYRIEPGGSESNVAIALQNLDLESQFVTKLPNNGLSRKILQNLSQFGVNTKNILIEGDKLGIYWTENGVGPRNSYVIYDRENTSFSSIELTDFNWKSILKDSQWFHFSGISAAISESVFLVLKNIVESVNIPYSVDLNFRGKLWKWIKDVDLSVEHVMTKLCSKATLIAGNESDFQNIFNITSHEADEDRIYADIAKQCFKRFLSTKYISISNRKSVSASSNIWNGYLFVRDDEKFMFKADEFTIENIQDRVGTGDSFVAGIIYSIINKSSYQDAINFAVSLSALNHTTIGDASRFSVEDVLNVINTKGSGRIIR